MISLLDCTLRDGGYVNDWEFGNNNLINIFERLVDSKVDTIEVGFLDERRPFDPNRSIMPDTKSVDKIYGHLDKGSSSVIAMIDYGTCGLSNIQPCSETMLDGIRVIFKKHLREPALEFCSELKKLGYKVYAQLVSVTSYNDFELLDLIRLANEVKPYAVSMVDTYGLMHQNNLMHYFDMLDNNLDTEIALGYHGHNNFQMGYANCISVINKVNYTKRNLLVDGSIYGMGKSAGNAPLELIMMHLNRLSPDRYDIGQILEAIDGTISQYYTPATWGYNLFFYVAALNNCHPNYVSFLMNKKTLSVKAITELLGCIPEESALLYNEQCIEDIYIKYQTNTIDDSEDIGKLKDLLHGRDVLLVGPGNLKGLEKKMKEYEGDGPVIITINCIRDGIDQDYIFLCNSKRYMQMTAQLSREKYAIIATSNLTKTGPNTFDYLLNYETLLEDAPIVADSATIMIMKILSEMGCRSISLAGLDGYSQKKASEFGDEEGAETISDMQEYINSYIGGVINNIGKKTKIRYLTKSQFEKYYEEV